MAIRHFVRMPHLERMARVSYELILAVKTLEALVQVQAPNVASPHARYEFDKRMEFMIDMDWLSQVGQMLPFAMSVLMLHMKFRQLIELLCMWPNAVMLIQYLTITEQQLADTVDILVELSTEQYYAPNWNNVEACLLALSTESFESQKMILDKLLAKRTSPQTVIELISRQLQSNSM